MSYLKKLSARDRKVLAIGGVAVAAILLIVYGLLPYLDAQQAMAVQLDERVRQLGGTLGALGDEEIYQARLDDVGQELAFYRSQLLDAPDTNMARVELESVVRALAEQNDIEISRSTFLPERNQDVRYGKLTLQITVRNELEELTEFLYQLSEHPKFLLVESFNVNALRRRGEIQLQHRLNISAYARLSE